MSRIRKTFDKKGVMIESSHTADYSKFIVDHQIEEVHISDIYYFNQDLDFLLSTPNLKRINITSRHVKDFQHVYSLQHLEELILDEPSSQFDFSKLKSNIKSLYLGYNKNVIGLEAIKDLEILNISNYKSNKNGLVNLLASNLNLHSLSIISCKIDTSILSKVLINFNYLKTMELDAIEAETSRLLVNAARNLESLSLTTIRKGLDFATIQIPSKLKVLTVSSTKGLKNIHVLNQYPQIEHLILLKCKFEDQSLVELKIDYTE